MDARLREHLRAWQASGDPEAERRFLVARLRADDLSWGAIECAAYLGDEVCRDLLGEDVLAFFPAETGISSFVRDLPCPDHEVALRAALALLDASTAPVAAAEPLFRAGVDAARAWLGCPCQRHWAAAQRVAAELEKKKPSVTWAAVTAEDPDRILADVHWTLKSLSHDGSLRTHGAAPHPVPCHADFPAGREEQARLREAIARALHPWVLERDEPPWDVPPDHPAREPRVRALRERRLAGAREPEALYVGGPLDPALARAVADAVGADVLPSVELKKDPAARVVRAFYEAQGWRPGKAKGALESPSGARRLVLRGATLELHERVDGKLEVKPTLARRLIPLTRVGERILAGLRAALGVAPAPAKKKRR